MADQSKYKKLDQIDSGIKNLRQQQDSAESSLDKQKIQRKIDSLNHAWYKEWDKISGQNNTSRTRSENFTRPIGGAGAGGGFIEQIK